jgi:hypothetical protein
MKKIASLIMLLGLTANVFSQQIKPAKKQLSSKEYLSKSSDQLVLGSILLAGGTALIFAGSNAQKNATGFDFSGIFIEALGVVTIGGSIPLFISAIHNHKKGKAISANIKLENSLSLQQVKLSCLAFPAVSVKINL